MVELLIEFQGIVGAILGVVVTLITTDIIRRFGKIDIHMSKYKMEFLKRNSNEYGNVKDEVVNNFGDVDLFNYSFELAIYNSSDINKSLFDVKIEFVDADNKVYAEIPYNQDKTQFTGHSWKHEEIDTIDLEPKRLKLIRLNGWIHREKLVDLTTTTNISKVYFVARNQKNKQFKRKIY